MTKPALLYREMQKYDGFVTRWPSQFCIYRDAEIWWVCYQMNKHRAAEKGFVTIWPKKAAEKMGLLPDGQASFVI